MRNTTYIGPSVYLPTVGPEKGRSQAQHLHVSTRTFPTADPHNSHCWNSIPQARTTHVLPPTVALIVHVSSKFSKTLKTHEPLGT